MLPTATITYDIADLTGVDFDSRRTRVWVTTNIPDGTIADTVGNQVRLGDGRGSLADDGTGSVTVWVPGTGSNPASWQTTLHVDYQPRGGGGRVVRTFGPFTITADANLADLVAEQAIPAAAVGGADAVATLINAVGGPVDVALKAAYVTRAPLPSGSATTDQANLQPLFDAAIAAGGGTVFLQAHPSGTPYKGDYTIGNGSNAVLPTIRGGGAKLDGTLTFRGATASFTGCEVDNLQMTGTRATGVPFWTMQGCVSVKWRRIKFSGSADVGILFHNKLAGEFTEMCSGVADFGENIKRKIEYRVTAGNPSFHGCGVEEGTTFNQSRTQTEPEIYIGAGAEPYNCPLSATFWAVTAQPLIKHLGLSTSQFYGFIKVELLPPNAKAVIVDNTSTSSLPLIGGLSRRGKRVERGLLLIGDDAVTETNKVITRRAGADVSAISPGNVLVIGPDGLPQWSPKIRTNRAKNPVVGNSTANFAGYFGSTVAQKADTSLGSANVCEVTFNNTASAQGFIYLEPGTDLAQGQTKTIAFDILSPVDIVMFAGGRFGLSGAPGVAEVGEVGGTTGGVEYIAANTVQRVKRVVTVPAPNSGGTITHEGIYIRANTVGDMPANGTKILVGNITIEDGVTSGAKFSGADSTTMNSVWTGSPHNSTSVQYAADAYVVTAEQTYTPSLTGITLGGGTLVAYYSKVGKRVTGSVYVLFAADTVVTGSIGFTLPTDSQLVAGSKRRYTLEGWMNDFSTVERFIAAALPQGTTELRLKAIIAGTGGYMKQVSANATIPFTWAVSDELLLNFTYETV